jgi:hypothetical protein
MQRFLKKDQMLFSLSSADVQLLSFSRSAILFRLTTTTTTQQQQQHFFSIYLSVCLSPPGSLLSISLNVYIFTQKNCGGELIAEIFVPLVCVRIIMVQKAKKKNTRASKNVLRLLVLLLFHFRNLCVCVCVGSRASFIYSG